MAKTAAPPLQFDVLNPGCPSRTVLRHLTDRWTALIVSALGSGPLRFTALRKQVGGITAKVLTETLRSMERDGLLERRVTPTVPLQVEYELTELGATLSAPIAGLRTWAEDHSDEVLDARERYDTARPA